MNNIKIISIEQSRHIIDLGVSETGEDDYISEDVVILTLQIGDREKKVTILGTLNELLEGI